MIAVAVSLFIALYIFLPELLFRVISSKFLPLPSFERPTTSRLEEFYRALRTIAVFWLLAYALVWLCPPFNAHPFYFPDSNSRHWADYEVIVSGLQNDTYFLTNQNRIWDAAHNFLLRNARLLFWYYLITVFAAVGRGVLVAYYGSVRKLQWVGWFIDRFILSGVPEWHAVLTNFLFSDKRTTVNADILSTDNTLYRGRVAQYFLKNDGSLSGLIVVEPFRYDRRAYLRDREAMVIRPKEDYWRPIPSANLYFFAEKIVNLNLNYRSPEPTPELVSKALSEILGRKIENLQISVEDTLGMDDDLEERIAKGIG